MPQNFRMAGTPADKDIDWDVLVATHMAHPGTYIVYAWRDGTHNKVPVVLWGVQQDGSPVPITIEGVWDGTQQANCFVLHPSGHCGRFERDWDTLEEAVAEMKELDTSPASG